MYSPKTTEVLSEQLLVWYKKLPPGLKFEFDMKPLLNHQKAFLRGHYYFLQLILYWPSVVRLLANEPDSDKQRDELHDNAQQAMKYGVAYIFATESLLLERHQMVFGNIVGLVLSTYLPFIILIFSSLLPVPSICTLFYASIMHLYYPLPLRHRLRSDCLIQSAPAYTNRVINNTFFAAMLLLTAYGTPALEYVVESVQQPSVNDAIRKSYELLSLSRLKSPTSITKPVASRSIWSASGSCR